MKKSLGAKTIAFTTPVWLIAVYDSAGKPNAMTAAWGGICCSQPPCVTVSLRKATYTYGCIMERMAYTVNIPSESQATVADYFGIASGKNRDKFAEAGLSTERSALVDAPYIKEFPLILECKVLHTLEIGLHTQFIGEIIDVKADESVLNQDGVIDVEKLRPFVFSPDAQVYHGLGKCLGKAFSIGKELIGK
jgi:flavin reductase (DIM6/NTAB) family NADH-FMN oxidoreductase RutF